MKRKHKPASPNPFCMWSWRADKRASQKQIREAIRYAQWEIGQIGAKSDEWYASASDVSRRWRDTVRGSSLHALARQHLEYWRWRAFMSGAYREAATGDKPAASRWREFA